MALSPKQQRFIEEYLVDLNATAAAIRAGYSAKTAANIGHELLRKPNIQAEIQCLTAARNERLELTADQVIAQLMNIAFADAGDCFHADGSAFDLRKLTKAQRAAIEVTVEKSMEGGKPSKKIKYRLSDKTRALELLGRRLKLWIDRHEVVGLADWEAFSERVQSMRRRMDAKPN